jgi:hypothetical protein
MCRQCFDAFHQLLQELIIVRRSVFVGGERLCAQTFSDGMKTIEEQRSEHPQKTNLFSMFLI